MDRHRLERSHQPDELCDVRVPEAVRVLPGEGDGAHARRPPQGEGRRIERAAREGRARRLPPPRARAVGNDGTLGLMLDRRRVKRARNGSFHLRLPPEERDLLRTLPGQLRELLESDDPSLQRLFPPAYVNNPEHEQEYRRLMADDLLRRRQAALDIVEETIDAEQLDEEQLTAWMGAINDLRLVLGTRLDVSEEMDIEGLEDDDPLTPAFALYGYLGWLQEQIVAALAGW